MGKLKIKLVECRNLVNNDFTSLSDPYVIFTIGKDVKKSSVILDNLHPVFNEKFVFEEYVCASPTLIRKILM